MKSIILLLIAHFVGDFVLQTRKIAEKKSKKPEIMLLHVGMYAVVLIAFMNFTMGSAAVPFAILNAAFHGIQDWIIWNAYRDHRSPTVLSEFWNDPIFYEAIGFDQLMHTCVLIGTYHIFIG